MDKAGVDFAVIGPTDRQFALADGRANESIRKMARRHKKRFIPSCAVNPWLGKAAVSESSAPSEKALEFSSYIRSFKAFSPTMNSYFRC